MKPKTELQRQAIALSNKLSPITDKQRQWAIDRIFKPTAFLRKRTTWCGECGHEWRSDNSLLVNRLADIICPSCGKRLKPIDCDRRSHADRWYYTVYDKAGGFQVIRHFVAVKECCIGLPAVMEVNECVQNWISPSGEVVDIARKTQMSGYCYDLWIYSSDMEVRGTPIVEQKYDVNAAYVYPGRIFIPELRRNGFTGARYGFSPRKIVSTLLSSPKAETLLKAKQVSLFKKFVKYPEDVEKRWPSVRICIRNNYIVEDAQIWLDYLDLLEHFEKDLRNAKYVCPANLKREHDRLSLKKHKKDAQVISEKHKKEFYKLKSKFFGIVFSDGPITVKVLESIQEYAEEGRLMKHCVFSNEYHLKPDTLVMAAIAGDKHVGTIEFSLKTFEIIQLLGPANKKSKFHDRIMELVNQNANLIRQRLKSKKMEDA
ncbi:PcfJ-like protein [Porphyromonadaceae bacterium KH3CP3RA]|nr:PcfJ-like protein [Porphyromonadaceae bacterium KH3CP3RA]